MGSRRASGLAGQGRSWTLRDPEGRAAFADVWRAIRKVVFSRALEGVEGNARLAEASPAEEAAALDATRGSTARRRAVLGVARPG
jgi:hypothetical protein